MANLKWYLDRNLRRKNLKRCPDCDEIKSRDEFYPLTSRNGNPVVTARCKPCHVEKTATYSAYVRKTTDEGLAQKRLARSHKAQKILKKKLIRKHYADVIRSVKRAKQRRWKAENPEKVRAYNKDNGGSKKRIKNRRPRHWAGWPAMQKRINAIYKFRRLLGEGNEVDHIIPLNGKNVSGLHVPDNLRIICAIENQAKGATYIP